MSEKQIWSRGVLPLSESCHREHELFPQRGMSSAFWWCRDRPWALLVLLSEQDAWTHKRRSDPCIPFFDVGIERVLMDMLISQPRGLKNKYSLPPLSYLNSLSTSFESEVRGTWCTFPVFISSAGIVHRAFIKLNSSLWDLLGNGEGVCRLIAAKERIRLLMSIKPLYVPSYVILIMNIIIKKVRLAPALRSKR